MSMSFQRIFILAWLLPIAAQEAGDKCEGVSCPAGTACLVAAGMTVCAETGEDSESSVPGGLRGTTTTPGDPLVDLKTCALAEGRCKEKGFCDNGSPPESMMCVMWPPYTAYALRRPKCKFCHKINDFGGAEKTECFYDSPQCLDGAASGSGGGQDEEEEPGFIEEFPGGPVVFYLCIVACVLGGPCCMFPCVYFLCMKQSEDEPQEKKGMWEPTVRDEPEPSHLRASPRDHKCESNFHDHTFQEHHWDSSMGHYEAPLSHRLNHHNSSGALTARLPERGSPQGSARHSGRNHNQATTTKISEVPGHSVRYHADGSPLPPRLSNMVNNLGLEDASHDANVIAGHHLANAAQGGEDEEARATMQWLASPVEGEKPARHSGHDGSKHHAHHHGHDGNGSPRARHSPSASPRRHSPSASPRQKSPRHSQKSEHKTSPRHSPRSPRQSAHGADGVPSGRKSLGDHEHHEHHAHRHSHHHSQTDGIDGGGASPGEHLRVRRPDDIAAVEAHAHADNADDAAANALAVQRLSDEVDKQTQKYLKPSHVPEYAPTHKDGNEG